MNARVSGLVLLCIPLAIECFLNLPSVCLLDLGQKGIANRFSAPSVFSMSEKTVLLPKQTSKFVLEQQCLLELFTKEVQAQLSSPENGSGWERSCRWCSFGPPFCGQPRHLPENMLWSIPWKLLRCWAAECRAETTATHLLMKVTDLQWQRGEFINMHFIDNWTSVYMRCHWRVWPRAEVLARPHCVFSMYRFIAGNCPHCSKWIDTWCCHYPMTVRNHLLLQCSVTRSSRVWLQLFYIAVSEGWGFLNSPVNL